MAFLETPRFPGCPSFGFRSIPMYRTTISRMRSGKEQRNRFWSRPLYRYDATVGPRMESEIQELLEFWHAVGGEECGFRFKDYADYKSCYVNLTASATDQPLIYVEEASDGPLYQLTKSYTQGARSQDREIYKPVSGSLLIAANAVTLTENTDYEVDYTTGLVTMLIQDSESDLTWGGEFDTPVRFDGEFPIELTNKAIESVSFSLMELRL